MLRRTGGDGSKKLLLEEMRDRHQVISRYLERGSLLLAPNAGCHVCCLVVDSSTTEWSCLGLFLMSRFATYVAWLGSEQ